MRFNNLKNDKGVAGLTLLLSIVVMLFVIGLLIMIFALMGNGLEDSVDVSTSVSVVNETLTSVEETGEDLAGSPFKNSACAVTIITNATGNLVISTGNYTATNCNIVFSGESGSHVNNSNWNVTYTYVYDDIGEAGLIINDTILALGGTIDWFDIFIVISAMVVLILLTVMIITSIRGSGLIASCGGNQNQGSA